MTVPADLDQKVLIIGQFELEHLSIGGAADEFCLSRII